MFSFSPNSLGFDSLGDFSVQQVALGNGINVLDLTPTFIADSPGIFGNIAFSFNVDPAEDGIAGFVKYTAIGTLGEEVISQKIETNPPPPYPSSPSAHSAQPQPSNAN